MWRCGCCHRAATAVSLAAATASSCTLPPPHAAPPVLPPLAPRPPTRARTKHTSLHRQPSAPAMHLCRLRPSPHTLHRPDVVHLHYYAAATHLAGAECRSLIHKAPTPSDHIAPAAGTTVSPPASPLPPSSPAERRWAFPACTTPTLAIPHLTIPPRRRRRRRRHLGTPQQPRATISVSTAAAARHASPEPTRREASALAATHPPLPVL